MSTATLSASGGYYYLQSSGYYRFTSSPYTNSYDSGSIWAGTYNLSDYSSPSSIDITANATMSGEWDATGYTWDLMVRVEKLYTNGSSDSIDEKTITIYDSSPSLTLTVALGNINFSDNDLLGITVEAAGPVSPGVSYRVQVPRATLT